MGFSPNYNTVIVLLLDPKPFSNVIAELIGIKPLSYKAQNQPLKCDLAFQYLIIIL